MITVVALLTIRDAEAFEQFERQAATIMKAYGGRIDSAFRPATPDSAAAHPGEEIHVLKFPDIEAFDRYRGDADLQALSTLRERGISHTTVYVSAREVDYSGEN